VSPAIFLLSKSHHETANEKAKQEWSGFPDEQREARNPNQIPGTARARTSLPYAPYFFTLKVHLFLPTASSVLASISTVWVPEESLPGEHLRLPLDRP
jgi:hypothetical protein